MHIYLSLLAITLSSLTFAGDIYHHELRQYPRGENCDLTATELAKKFSEVSGAEIYWAGPIQESPTTCDIKISYVAAKELELTGTVDRSGMGGTHKGTKRTLKECIADLPREEALFKTSTGLEPWVAYCYQESNFLNALPAVPVVEGIGKPNRLFYSSDGIFSVTPNYGWANMLDSAWKTSADQGLLVASFSARPYISASLKEVTVRYYADERLFLRADGVAPHKRPQICETQIEEFRAELAKAEIPPIGVYCGKYAHEDYRVGIVTLSTNVIGIANLRAVEDSKRYAGLSDCRAEVPATVEFYRTKLGKKILAGICANGKGAFQITLIEEKKDKRP